MEIGIFLRTCYFLIDNLYKSTDMRKLLFLSLLLFPLLGSGEIETSNCTSKAKSVYICTGPQSKVYHSTNECKGLSRCSASVDAVTLKEAQDLGRRACKVCY